MLESGPETLPVVLIRVDAFGKAEADEEFFFDRIRQGFPGANGFAAFGSLHVVPRRFYILPARNTVERMRVRAKSDLRRALPVLQIVERVRAGAREV